MILEMISHIISHVNDIRFRTFFNLAQVLRSFKIYFILKEEYLKNREWYVETYLSKCDEFRPDR
jgi:hypothetical protein